MERELLTIQEAADFFGVTTKTLRRWELKGLLLPKRTAGNQRRYSRDQLLAFQDSKSLEEPVTPLTQTIASQLPLPQLPLPIKQGFFAAKKRAIFFIAGAFTSLGLLAISLLALSQASSNDADKLAENLRTTGKALNVKLGNEQKTTRPERASDNAVLGDSKFSPTFNFTVSVPSTFKQTVKLKSTLDISDLATFSANITAPNILYGVTAGTGINVGSGQNPVISNTGVLSLQGQTGALAFTAGNGIAFNGLTIENNDRGSDQKIFQNILVGDKTISAGSNKDSFEFLAGTGISLDADTSGKKIRITGTAEGAPPGWTASGGTVILTTSTDTVGIGTTNPSSFKLQVAGNVGPDANNSYDLGSSSLQWRNIYAGTSLTVSSDTVSDLTGAGLTLSSGTLTLDLLTSADGTGTTSNFSGLELKNNHLTLLQGCSNNQLLKWDDGNNVWACSNDLGGTGSSINVAEGASTYSGIDTVNFNQNDFDVTQNTTTVTVTLDNTLARFRLNNGAVYAANSTTDLLLGGSATSSAKLAFININTGTPTASISANNGNNATYIAGDGTLATTNSQTLTLGGSTTGSIILSPNNGNNKVTSTGTFNLVSAKTFQINNTDVLSDSTLGTGVITSSLTTVGVLNAGSITSGFGAIDIGNDNLSSSGTITFGAFTANGGLLYTNGSGVLAQTTVGSGGQCLISNGGGAPTWGACNTPITNFWQLNSGALSPTNSTVDLLIGATATSSAKFAVINVDSGTPTASLSAGTNGGSYLTADGTLATTAQQTLNLGSATTGTIALNPNNGNNKVTSTGSLNLSSGKTFQINNSDVLSSTTLGNTVLTSSLTTVGTISTGVWNGTVIGSQFGGTGLNTSASTGVPTIASGTWSVAPSLSPNLGGTGLTSYATGDLIYASGANTLANRTIGSNGDILTVTGGVPTWTASNAILFWQRTNGTVEPRNITDDLLLGATATSSAKFAFFNVAAGSPTASVSAGTSGAVYITADGTIATTAQQTLNLGNATTGTINLNPNGGTNKVNSTGTVNVTSGKTYQINNTDVLSSTTLGSSVVNSSLTSVGTISTGVWNGTVIGAQFGGTGLNTSASTGVPTIASGTWSVSASLGPTVGGTGLTSYNQGDIIYASAANTLSKLGIGGTGTCLGSNGTVPAWTSCAANQYWQLNVGALSPFSNSTDLLLGGTATASAKFAFINVNSGTPVASVSAGTTGGTYLTADGKLATTAKQDLTLGDSSTTGNVLINPSGNLGLGTTAPQYKFDVVGNAFQVRDAATATKAYRFRTTGSALDFEAGGADMYLSDWSNPDYTGTQNFYIRLESGAHNADLNGSWNFLTGNNSTNPAYAIISESGITFNQQQATNLNFRVKGDNDTNTFLVDTSSDSVNIGTSTPLGKFQVNSAATGKALAIFNETGNQALLTASASGTTKFTIDHSGNIIASGTISGLTGINSSGTITFSTFTNNGGLLYTDASGNVAQTTVGSGGQCLQSNGGGAPSWTSCSTPSANFWQLNNGAISPFSNTADVLIGATATTSAKVGFLNTNSGTPTASISANSGNNATYISGTGTVATTNMQNLTVGGSTTGSITIDPGIGGIALGDVNTDRVTFNAQILGGSPFVFQGATDNGFTTTFNVSDPTANRTITLPNNSGTIPLNTSGSATGGTSAFVQGGQTWATTATLGTQDSNTLNIITNNSTRLSIDATGNVGIGTTSQVTKLHVSGATTGKALSIFDETGDQNILTASASGVTKLTLDRSGNLGIAAGAGLDTLTAGSLTIGGTTQNALTLGRSGAGTTVAGSSLTLSTFTTDKGILYTNGSGTVSQTAQGAANTVLHGNGTGAPTFSAVSLINDITGTLGSGNGGTGISTYTQGDLIYASATNTLSKLGIGGTGTCLGSNGTVPAWTSCAANQYWQVNAGALSPFSNTADVLFGGTATASANFAFINNTGAGTPTASVSAGTAGGVYLTAQGKLATTAKQNLTLGDTTTTGNVIINPSGKIGIGTTTPGSLLTVNDASGNGGTLVSITTTENTSVGGNLQITADTRTLQFGANSNIGPHFGSTTKGGFMFLDSNAVAPLLALSPSNNQVDLGATTYRFKDLYLGGTSYSDAIVNSNTALFGTSKKLRITPDYAGLGELPSGILVGSSTGDNLTFLPDDNNAANGKKVELAYHSGSGTNYYSGLELADVASGFSNLILMKTGGNVGIGNSTPVAKLDVNGAVTGKALTIFNETGDQNILTASASGTTKFSVDRNGNLGIAGSSVSSSNYITAPNFSVTTAGLTTIASNLVLSNSSATTTFGGIAYTWPTGGQAAGYALTTNGSGTLSWTDPVTLGSNWNVASGAISPKMASVVDLLLGSTASSSAKFAFKNVLTGTPTASISAGTNGAVYLDATGALATTAKQSLTFGDGNTGNLQFYSSSNTLTSAGDLTLAGDITVNGGDILGAATTNLLNAATTVNLGSTNVTRTLNFGTGTNADTINIGTGGTTADIITIGATGLNATNGSFLNLPGGFITSGTVKGKALAIFNETGDQNILTASASGTTRFTLDRNGSILTTTNSTGGSIITSDLSAGAKSTDVFTITQPNDSSNDNSQNLLQLTNLDTGSTAPLLKLDNSNLTGTGIDITFSGSGSGGVGINTTVPTAGTGISLSSNTTGNSIVANSAGITSGTAFLSAGSASLGTSATFNGTVILVNPTHNMTAGSAFTNSGNFLNLTRADTVSNASGSINTTGDLATLSSNCIVSSGTCTDSSSILKLTQSFALSTGSVLNVAGSGLGSMVNVSGNSGGKAATVINQTSTTQALLTASTSGTTRFTLANDGSISQTPTTSTGTTTSAGYALNANSLTSGTGMYLTSSSINSGKLLDINTAAANTLTSGTLLNIANSSSALTTGNLLSSAYTGTAAFSGNLNYFDWTPGSATTATGDLFRIHIGPNGNATNLFNIVDDTTSLFSVNETQITSAIPHQFTAAGDLGLAYDLQFTNQTSSYIKSNAPLYLEAGESFESNDLTFRTFNSGNIIFDLSGNSSGTGGIGIGAGITPNSLFEINGRKTGKALVSLNETGDQAILTASVSGSTRFTLGNDGSMTLRNSETIDNTTNGKVNVASDSGQLTFDVNGWIETNLNHATSSTEAVCGTSVAEGAANSILDDCTTSVNADYAEIYPSESDVDYGDIVIAGPNSILIDHAIVSQNRQLGSEGKYRIPKITKSTAGYQASVIGVVSNNWSDFSSTGGQSIPQDANPKPVALNGRVPVKVASNSPAIAVGDYLTTSGDQPGRAMKATTAGIVIGKALEAWDPASGKDKVMLFVQNVWYDPDIFITSTGDVSIVPNPNTVLEPYKVVKSSGEEVKRSAVFTSAAIANLNAGVINAKKLSIDGVDLMDLLSQYQGASSSATLVASESAVLGLQATVDTLTDQTASLSARLAAVETQAAQTASDAAFLKTIMNSPIGSGTDSASLITDLEALDVKTATVSGTLNVLGKTTLADIGITGNITAGILSIHGLTGEINTLGGPLQLQPLGIEPVEIMGGKVVIDTNGNIDTAGTLTAQKVNIPTTPVNSASAGEGTIAAATQQITINTHAVTAQSLIYITFTDDYAPATRYWIDSKLAGTSFTIKLDKTVTSNTKFNWWIVN